MFWDSGGFAAWGIRLRSRSAHSLRSQLLSRQRGQVREECLGDRRCRSCDEAQAQSLQKEDRPGQGCPRRRPGARSARRKKLPRRPDPCNDRRVKHAAIGAVIVVVVGFGAFQVFFPTELDGVERPASLGRGHLAQSELGRYGTPTPTSGAHSASSPRCGIFDQQLPAELAVHALEHGATVIWYRLDLEEQVVSRLRQIVSDFDDRVILSPNAELLRPVVATAWNRLKPTTGPSTS